MWYIKLNSLLNTLLPIVINYSITRYFTWQIHLLINVRNKLVFILPSLVVNLACLPSRYFAWFNHLDNLPVRLSFFNTCRASRGSYRLVCNTTKTTFHNSSSNLGKTVFLVFCHTLVWLVRRRINHILQSTVYELSGESKSQWKANKSINYLATSYSSSTVYLHAFWTRTNNPNMCNTTSRQIPSGYLFTRRKRTNTHNTRVYPWWDFLGHFRQIS